MKVLLVLGWGPRECHQFEWQADPGATVADAARHLETVYPLFHSQPPHLWHVAVWGKPASMSQALKEDDRIEWLRGLRVDPKVARRERFEKQGSRAAGLFARRKPGAKAGY
jgi:putative ubiquitin-RnfH superfamily antitoxin RatB of RatAB toxin-antitoxin module